MIAASIEKLTLVIGAGDDFDVAVHPGDGSQFILIEADSDAANELKARYRQHDNVEVRNEIISADGKDISFYGCFPPEWSSTLKPCGVKTMMPGLKVETLKTEPSTAITQLATDISKNIDIELYLQVPGQELQLLKALEASTNLDKLKKITLQTSNEELYVDGNTTNEVLAFINQTGFILETQYEQQWGLTKISCRRDREKELEQRLAEAIVARDKAIALVSDTNKELEQIKQQLNETKEQANNEQRKVKELEEALNQANEEKQKHTDWAHNLKQQLEQTQTELKEQQRSAQLSTKLLAKVEADASELRERYAEKVKSEQELKDLIKELHAKLQAASHFYHKLEQEHPELLEKL